MKQAVHDNINPFLGLIFEGSQKLQVVWNHCFRGTLTDIIFGEAGGKRKDDDQSSAFDQNFRAAFVRDLVRVSDPAKNKRQLPGPRLHPFFCNWIPWSFNTFELLDRQSLDPQALWLRNESAALSVEEQQPHHNGRQPAYDP